MKMRQKEGAEMAQNNGNKERQTSKARVAKAADAIRSGRAELSAGRGREVYKTDPSLFAVECRAGTNIPLTGTKARVEWEGAMMADLRAGMSQTAVAVKYRTTQATVSRIKILHMGRPGR